jgi:recombination protein RecA
MVKKIGLIEKSGAWYSLDGEKIGQGKVNASNFLKENQKIKEKLLKEIRKSLLTA